MKEMIQKVVRGENLTEDEMAGAMMDIIDGKAPSSQAGSLVTALRMKGETVDEIVGAARALNKRVQKIETQNHLLNMDRDDIHLEEETIVEVSNNGIAGTRIFNVSAATTFVAAGGGISVVRYGNRRASRFLGTADVLEYMGIQMEISISDVERCIEEVGIGFMFAPVFHGPLKHVTKLREELGVRTIFNLIGPLANPAGSRAHVLGVYHAGLTEKIARVIARLGGENALVFHGEGTIDEMSTCGATKVSHLKNGEIETFKIDPVSLGFEKVDKMSLRGGNIRENAAIVQRILNGEKGPGRDLVLLNAAAAFWVAGLEDTLQKGIERAVAVIDSGAAKDKFDALVRFTQQCAPFSLSAYAFEGENI